MSNSVQSRLCLPPIGLGTMNFGAVCDENESHKICDHYVAEGGSFIDTANVYSLGNKQGHFHEHGFSEQFIGNWLKHSGKRDKVLLATKVGLEMGDGFSGLSRKSIFHQINESLKRLRTDVIDLYQAHCFDANTPLEETLHAFNDLVALGKIRFFGCSNYTKAQIEEATMICQRDNIPQYVTYQNGANLLFFNRNRENQYLLEEDDLKKNNIKLIAFNVLANGFLAGRFKDVTKIDSSRGESTNSPIRRMCFQEKPQALYKLLEAISNEYHVSIGAVTLAWYQKCPLWGTSLVGPRTYDQIRDLLSPKIELSDEYYEAIKNHVPW